MNYEDRQRQRVGRQIAIAAVALGAAMIVLSFSIRDCLSLEFLAAKGRFVDADVCAVHRGLHASARDRGPIHESGSDCSTR